ncbi:MAG TPA: hypothetical protein PLF81_23195 [Candidatus Anammoximicrobium sp.]|nr:hypothetical protein [Candidatus Anammoximicrobium sp.]
MIAAPVTRRRNIATNRLREHFLSLLPSIADQARFAFRGEPRERRQELIAEVIANAFVAFARLVERGLTDAIYPSPLAQYAIRQVRDGRRVGAKLNVHDVSSDYAQRSKRFTVERLDRFDERTGEWKEVLIEDKNAGPAETASARIDIGDWFASLPRRNRRIAQTLATGETTKQAARKFRVSPGRVSQLRREFQDSWADFQGESALA